nr:LOC100158389 protein [Xenopus laevis]
MSDSSFETLLQAVAPLIAKQDTCMRQAIPAEQRLIATLQFLATGRSLEDLKIPIGISAQSLGHIIPETCNAIFEALKTAYLKFPSTEAEWKATARHFEEFWNFPNCGGAIVGKHVRIKPPSRSGSYFTNYKGYNSIVLLAIVNAKYEFLMVDVGKNGRVSSVESMEQTYFYQRLQNHQLQLPSNSDTSEGMNYVFVTGEEFALHEHILTPFPQKDMSFERRIFNYRLSRARRVADNAFGILSNRFRIFHTAINLSPSKTDSVVLACCVLHNFLCRTSGASYMPATMLDREDTEQSSFIAAEWRLEPNGLLELQDTTLQNATVEAKLSRDRYAAYFNGAGAVEWQAAMVLNGN